MTYIDAIIIAIIEGLTEFLPISSTGHMILASTFLGLKQDEFVQSFEIMIQAAAICAVLFYYRKKLFIFLSGWKTIVVGSLPILIMGYLFRETIPVLFTAEIVAWSFIFGGAVFLIAEQLHKKQNQKKMILPTGVQSLIIGLSQMISLIPGMSRSGATIVGGMFAGMDRKSATEFSFLLAVPVMMIVTAYQAISHHRYIGFENLDVLVVGGVVAFIVAYISIVFLVRFVATHSFTFFGWYRILFGMTLLLFFI